MPSNENKCWSFFFFLVCLSVLFDFSIVCEWKGIRAMQEELFTASAFFPDSWGLCGLSHGSDGYNLGFQFFPFGDQPRMGGAGTDLLPTLWCLLSYSLTNVGKVRGPGSQSVSLLYFKFSWYQVWSLLWGSPSFLKISKAVFLFFSLMCFFSLWQESEK